jgi:hypothetical protein
MNGLIRELGLVALYDGDSENNASAELETFGTLMCRSCFRSAKGEITKANSCGLISLFFSVLHLDLRDTWMHFMVRLLVPVKSKRRPHSSQPAVGRALLRVLGRSFDLCGFLRS